MKTLLVGSLVDGASNPGFQSSCGGIGRIIADRGWTLIVGGNANTDAEHWALSGANKIGCEVFLYPPEDAAQGWSSVAPSDIHPGPTALLDQVVRQFPKLRTTLMPPPPGNWNVGYAQAVAYADAVILIGGKDGTRFVGQLATALLKPVVAIPYFGGSSREEWTRQRARYDSLRERGKVSNDVVNGLCDPNPEKLSTAVTALCEAMIRDGRAKSLSSYNVAVVLVFAVVLIIVWTVIFIWPTEVKATVQRSITPVAPIAIAKLAVLLWTSTSAGVIFQAAWRYLKKPVDLLSLASIGADLLLGFLTAFAYLILCFAGAGIYKQNPFDLTAEDITRMGVVLSVSGFAIGASLDQAAEYLSEKLVRKFRS